MTLTCGVADTPYAAQQQRLSELGVLPDRIYLDRGLTDTNRARPGLD